MRTNVRGFTLIELLIVIAIIAILALIAIPNFLEAQVRAKVSRVNADMRSITVAIEGYTVDYGRAPIGMEEGGRYDPEWWDNEDKWFSYRLLTTPIAYLTSVPIDPFIDKQRKFWNENKQQWIEMNYVSFHYGTTRWLGSSSEWGFSANERRRAYSRGYKWFLDTVGPAKGRHGTNSVTTLLGSDDPAQTVTAIYDPTNGTMSEGMIIRTNKGAYTGPGT